MAVNYEYYRYFYYVAKYRNLTLAAAAMKSSQPNLTRVMRNLEQQLGCRLFIRSNRGIVLTEEGEALYAHVAVAVEQLLQGEEALHRSVDLQTGTVCLGTSETALHELLLEEIQRFHQTYPAVRLKIRNYSTPSAINALRNGEIDFAVVATPVEVQTPLQRRDLKEFRDLLVCGRQYSKLAGRKLELREAAKYPMVSLARDTTAFDFYSRFYQRHGLELTADIEVASADLVVPLVKNGLGLGFLPEDLALPAIRRGQLIRLDLAEELPPRRICLIRDTHRGLGVAAGAFRSLLESATEE